MDTGLAGRTVVVTGGGSGIGLEAARLLLAEGARVAICGRDEAKLERASRDLLASVPDGQLYAARCDVLDDAAVQAFAADVAARLGPADSLVCNAGQGRRTTFADTDDAAWLEELRLKHFSLIYPVRAFKPQLQRSDAASIVVVNAMLALQPEPTMVATSAARAGVQNLARSLATEFLPDGIRVNTVVLGILDSDQWRRRHAALPEPRAAYDDWMADQARARGVPMGRLGRPIEAARAIVFLASPLASFTTGASLDVSGGAARFI